MPNTSAQVKIDAVREYGAVADLIGKEKTNMNEKQTWMNEPFNIN